jgi:hypothetical protein
MRHRKPQFLVSWLRARQRRGAALLIILSAILFVSPVSGAPQLGNSVSPDGKQAVQVDVPLKLRLKNTVGTDGTGLCVFTSIQMAAWWSADRCFDGFRDKMRAERGGGWPEKVDRMVAKYVKGGLYLQYEGPSMEVAALALKTGRLPCATYNGHDPHNGAISHMLNPVCLTDKWACVLDNNHIGPNDLVWMSPAELQQRMGGKSVWIVVLLRAPPPPIPFELSPIPDAELPAQAPAFEGAPLYWRFDAKDPDRVYLFSGSVQAGAYDYTGGYFRAYYADEDEWGSLNPQPPYAVPPRPAKPFSGKVPVVGGVVDYGVSWGSLPLKEGQERFRINGKVVTRQAAFAALGCGQCPGPGPCPLRPGPQPGPAPPRPQPNLPDDSGLLRLTVIGADADRAKVLADLDAAPELAAWKGRLVVQDLPPGHVLLTDAGFSADPFQVIVQAPPDRDGRGKVLHRQTVYGGAAQLAAALRKADPLYRPDLDPDLTRPLAPKQPLPLPGRDVGVALALAAALAVPVLLLFGLLALIPIAVVMFRPRPRLPAPLPVPLPLPLGGFPWNL